MLTSKYGYALVTGASGGLGREFALQLAEAGWRLILVGRSAEKLEETKRSMKGASMQEAAVMKVDLSKPGAAAALRDECLSKGYAVELLINNAGSGLFGRSMELPSDKVESMIALNVIGLTSLCALFGRDMAIAGSGRILNVGSLVGKYAMPYFASYAATKSYVLSYSLALRAELKGSGVSVSCVLPGYIRTAFDERAGIESPAYRSFSERNGMNAQAVARAGLKLLEKNKPYGAAGARNRIASAVSVLVPRSLMPVMTKPILDQMLQS
jgi:uncharacterized protein